jgi:hypothetical protein
VHLKKNEGRFWRQILSNQVHGGRVALQPDATKRLIARFLTRKGLWTRFLLEGGSIYRDEGLFGALCRKMI